MRPTFSIALFGAFVALFAARVRAEAILTVDASGSDFTTLKAAVEFADTHIGSYYTIQISPGIYSNDFAVVTAPMTIKAASGGAVILDATQPPTNGKAIITTSASTTLIGLTFQNAAVSPSQGSNGAGIRDQAGTSSLIVKDSVFINNQDGILADADLSDNVSISGSSFFSNGFDAGGGSCPSSGCDHAMYIGGVSTLNVSDSLFCGTLVGHDIKSRAARTTLSHNKLFDGAADGATNCPAGSTSYAIDLPNGGDASIVGNQIFQGMSTQNVIMVDYGEEGFSHPTGNNLVLSDNVLNSKDAVQSIGINDPFCVPVRLLNNAFQGVSIPVNPERCAEYVSQPIPEPGGLPTLLCAIGGCSAARLFRRRAVLDPGWHISLHSR